MSQTHNPIAWRDWYKKEITHCGLGVYFAIQCQKARPFLATVLRHFRPGSRLLECGIGPGVLSIYLGRSGYQVTGVDINPDVVEFARQNNERLEGMTRYVVGDMFEVDKTFGRDAFDGVFSAGTLEHFSDAEILKAIRTQFVVAKLNIIVVPCANVRPDIASHMYGDERLLKVSDWERLIRQANGEIIDRFGYWFDATRIGAFNWRIPVLAETLLSRHLARFAGDIGFVVRRREQ